MPRQEKAITSQPQTVAGASTRGGGVSSGCPEKTETKREIPRPIIMRPGRPIINEETSRRCGFSLLKREKPFFSGRMYHKRARDGIVYVKVRPSSRIIEKGITAPASPEKGEEKTPGKKRTRYRISGSIGMANCPTPFDNSRKLM